MVDAQAALETWKLRKKYILYVETYKNGMILSVRTDKLVNCCIFEPAKINYGTTISVSG
jgi:hypothetical protein